MRSPVPSAAAPAEPRLHVAGARRPAARAFGALAVHLTVRQLRSSYHLTLLGWGWPVARQLAQLAVLVFVFGRLFDFDIDNYPAFVFVGLVAWTWFAGGVSAASTSVLGQRHLVMQPRLPPAVLPIAAVAVPFVDVLFAAPVLLVMLALSTGLGWAALLCPLVLAVQLVLAVGLGWFVAGISVFFRDVPNLVSLALLLLFYLTPVFYDRRLVPERFRWVLDLNPLTTLIELYRALLLGTPVPSPARLAAVTLAAGAAALVGHRVFSRLAPRFADHL